MKITNIQLYGAAGGESRTGRFNVTIEASDVDTCAEAKALIQSAPDLLAALENLVEFAEPILRRHGFGYMGRFEAARREIAKARA